MKQISPQKLEQNAEMASKLLKSMSHPSRLMVLCHLMDGECPVSVFNQAVPLSQSALSQHLAALRKADLVTTRREGQVIYYRLKSQAVAEILEALYRIYCNPNNEE
ncbi:metalloregulator ArsR/SmtB family transcription factor [uncultured Desulfobacter sp.]|uniref:ArsR/SmtB family transcription factor n=1 Tax=uncultured Desulfobacter sp. TaxID=240139 RepID=UPI0029F479F1|nr:metalloregulator ArsR/SmtB family transcription factor [uncultured Desulfobacter sp.]